MAASASAEGMHMQTTEPQTVSESVEEPLPPQSTDKTGSSPASQVVQDTTTPATMGSSKPPQSESDVHAKMRGELEGQQPQDAISTLHSLFPSLDKETIQDIYRAQGQDADRTASLLIQLSGDAPEIDSVLHGEHQQQISSDEAFARQLAEEEAAAVSHAQPQSQYSNLSYQPRVTPRAGNPPPPQQHEQSEDDPHARDEFDQAMDQVKAAAASATEYGKGIFNKLSTRFQQIQMGQQQEGGASSPQPSRSFSSNISGGQQQQQQRQTDPQELSRPVQTTARSQSGRMAPALPHADRYRQSSPQPQSSTSTADPSGYSTEPDPVPSKTEPLSSIPGTSVEAERQPLPVQKDELPTITPKAAAAVPPSSSQSDRLRVKQHDDSDSDDDEYVRNPFDDRD